MTNSTKKRKNTQPSAEMAEPRPEGAESVTAPELTEPTPVVDEEKEALKREVAELKGRLGEAEEFKAKYYYALAEQDNAQKRFLREKEDLRKYGNEQILEDLLEVVDNLDRTLNALAGDQDAKVKNIVFGIEMISKQFIEVLGRRGLKSVEALGKEFDPHFHEAIAEKFVEGKGEHEVIEEFQKGYLLNGRLLRAAKVSINKVQE